MALILWVLTQPAFAATVQYETSIVDRLRSFVGIFMLAGIAWALSENRGKVQWRVVGWGIGLQLVFGAIVLSPTVSGFFYTVVNTGVNQLLAFSGKGAEFVFQSTEPHLIEAPDGTKNFYAGTISPPVKTFAFWVLPTIVFFSSLMSVLYYYGVMQRLVQGIAKLMVFTLGTSGAESLSAAGNIFVGQTEAPLLVKPFIKEMTRSEVMAVMTGGFATVSGGIMGAYVMFLGGIPNIAGHLVIASIISAPAALACAKLMVPETATSHTAGGAVELPAVGWEDKEGNVHGYQNGMEAVARGASDGMSLAINVAAMLIAIVALVAMADWFISWVPVSFCTAGGVAAGYGCGEGVAFEPLTLSRILSWVFAPIAFLMGAPMADVLPLGRLLGEKIVLTEFIAYMNLGALVDSETPVITQRTAIMASYALCGFANFASIGIQIGGIGGIAPNKYGELAALGFKAMLAGAIAACMTGAVVGVML